MSWICEQVFVKDKGACSVQPEEELQRAVLLITQEEWQQGSLTHLSDRVLSDEDWSAGELGEDEEEDDEESSSSSDEVSPDASDLE